MKEKIIYFNILYSTRTRLLSYFYLSYISYYPDYNYMKKTKLSIRNSLEFKSNFYSKNNYKYKNLWRDVEIDKYY